ncbi:aldehyde dehydrogenase family protein [Pedomonas mirosovicensis]|uniref:aldehyde dehydrogenase family protein n=1 Tax=Pedomonas mirosovicensis TaxID=2908641 RepID=UPI002166E8A5|nr:aldehyde dehydrogenase family protein [Pedomonas mirosovicensis]MCH8684609.1 aldehyde dehydrogenase family protein [Pedomonas mirosovicensis]
MQHSTQFYINGAWVEPEGSGRLDVINPATEQPIGQIALGTGADVNKAVAAAHAAFPAWEATSREERLALLDRIIEVYKTRLPDIAEIICDEMGAPLSLAQKAQAAMGLVHLATTRQTLANLSFEEQVGTTHIFREPIGVVAMITPWNWPINQIAAKVAPALAAGCTMVLKPSEIAPLNAILFAEVLHEAGVPAGVFNLVNGDGPTVGTALSQHPDVSMVSFTGSTRAGILVAKNAADTVKRVAQELGGKSPNIILDDADFEKAVTAGFRSVCVNAGQSCNAPTRMLLPHARYEEAIAIAKAAAEKVVVGNPRQQGVTYGPVASEAQWNKIQGLIETAIKEGARLITGGPGKPEGLNVGYYVRPTLFADVTNDMTIAREEVFGPVLVLIPYETEEEAIRIANDTPYGLSAYVTSGNLDRARRIAARLRAGNVHINGASLDPRAPFGGYKQSGNGREFGIHGILEFMETKAVLGYAAA